MLDAERIDDIMKRAVTTVAVVLYQGEDVPAHSLGIFTPEWVDRLYRGIKRNTTRPFRFVCFVDQEYMFSEPVESIPFKLPYRNMFSLLEPFSEDLGRVLFMGLDTIITGNIDHLMDYRGPFAMLKDPWHDRPCSGVMAFPYSPQIWDKFAATHEEAAKRATMFGFASDMIYLADEPHYLLDDLGLAKGIYSYKAHIKGNEWRLKDSCIIYFHGREKPHELDHDWVKEHWGPPLLTPIKWVDALNNDPSVMLEQVKQNLSLDVPFLAPRAEHKGTALIVGGGPSLKDSLVKLRFHQQRGGEIYALNGTHDWLIERGIVPDYHVLLDSRPDNVCFVQKPHKAVKYLVSAQCHPSMFEALKGFDVTLWVSDADGVQELVKDREDKPIVLVGGGATVGMKTMYMVHILGYRKMHFFGFDSSYRDEENHAYPQPLNAQESRMEISAGGKVFTCAPWMAKQAMEFQKQARKLLELGCRLTVHGDGLIPHIMEIWNAADRNRRRGTVG